MKAGRLAGIAVVVLGLSVLMALYLGFIVVFYNEGVYLWAFLSGLGFLVTMWLSSRVPKAAYDFYRYGTTDPEKIEEEVESGEA